MKILATLAQMSATFPVSVWLVHAAPPDPDFVGYEPGPRVVRGQVAAEHHARHQELQQMTDRLHADGVEVTALLLQGSTVGTGRGAVHTMLVGRVGRARAARARQTLKGVASPS